MSDVSVAAAAAAAPKLDDLMLAMDVVDTLRHDQRVVERELSAGRLDETLIKRLREIYKSQGIKVPTRFSRRASRRCASSASPTSRQSPVLQ